MEKSDSDSSYEDFEPMASPTKRTTMTESLRMMATQEFEKWQLQERESKGLTVEEQLRAELKVSN